VIFNGVWPCTHCANSCDASSSTRRDLRRNGCLEISMRDLQLDEFSRAVVARKAGSEALSVFANGVVHGNDGLIVVDRSRAALLGVTVSRRCGCQRGG